MTALARQYALNPKMVVRWATELERKDLEQLDGTQIKIARLRHANEHTLISTYSHVTKTMEERAAQEFAPSFLTCFALEETFKLRYKRLFNFQGIDRRVGGARIFDRIARRIPDR